ncbi:MAG: alpha/beta fold hydrolase [Steroidobacteraceae bacterium]
MARYSIEAARVGGYSTTTDPPQLDISPSGQAIVYVVTEPSLESNNYAMSVWLARVREKRSPTLLVRQFPSGTPSPVVTPRFSPDGKRIAYFQSSAAGVRLMIATIKGDGRADIREYPLGGIPAQRLRPETGLEWSPDGSRIAIGIAGSVAKEEDTLSGGIDTDLSWFADIDNTDSSRLAIVDVRAGTVTVLGDASLFVHDLAWSPNGATLAFSASPQEMPDARFMRTDIYLMDLRTGKVDPLVVQPGIDDHPSWSPDGQKVAFLTSGGATDWSQRSIVGLVDVSTRTVSYPGKADVMSLSADVKSRPVWLPDGKGFLVTMLSKLSQAVYKVPADGRPPKRILGEDLASYDNVAVAKRAGHLVYTRQSPEEPRDLYVLPGKETRSIALTHYARTFKETIRASATTNTISWPSTDGHWTIHGAIMSGAGETAGGCSKDPPPMLVFVEGGPSMVRLDFNLDAQYPLVAFAEAGVSVFAPNTRGRSGFGKAFLSALAEEGHWGSGPFADIESGVQYLTNEKRVSINGAVGIVGHSYGGYLVAYALTQTDRFKSAAIFDAQGPPLSAGEVYVSGTNSEALALYRALYGMGSPFERAAYSELEHESPLRHIDRAHTPTLLEFGCSKCGGNDSAAGVALFQGLQHFHVPSKFIRYPHTGHRLTESLPSVQLESAKRNLEWFWYWVLDAPIPDLVREFGEREPKERGVESACAG